MDPLYGNQPDETEQQLGPRTLFWASWWSGLFLVACSVLAARLIGTRGWRELIGSLGEVPESLLLGAAGGAGAGLVVCLLWRRAGLSAVRSDLPLVDALLAAEISPPLAAWISVWAGFAEELFFRGVLQPAIGLWLTAVLFVALHGYLRWDGSRHLLFAALMLGLSAGLGYLARSRGLAAAMTAHAVYDFVLLTLLGGSRSRT